MSEPAKKAPTSPWVYLGYILIAFLAIFFFGQGFVSCSTDISQGSRIASTNRFHITWTLEAIGMVFIGILCLIWIGMGIAKKKPDGDGH